MEVSARELVVRRGVFVLRVASLQCDAGGTAILGPNGAGKTTLLGALQGLILCSGDVERPARSAGVFAQPVFLRGTAGWNVAIVARTVRKMDAREADARSASVLRAVGLEAHDATEARRLSSGERQRLALARALIVEPHALFLDEPFANVDADGRPALRALLRAYVDRTGCALLLATQNLADVRALCRNALLVLDGHVAAHLAAADIERSGNQYLRALADEASATATGTRDDASTAGTRDRTEQRLEAAPGSTNALIDRHQHEGADNSRNRQQPHDQIGFER